MIEGGSVMKNLWIAVTAAIMAMPPAAAAQDQRDENPRVLKREQFIAASQGVLPEEVRKHFNLPEGATINDLPAGVIRPAVRPARTYQHQFADPVFQPMEIATDASLRTGEVLARQVARSSMVVLRLTKAIALPRNFKAPIPAGELFALHISDDDDRPEPDKFCRMTGDMVTFVPLKTSDGTLYPTPCLGDRSGTGDWLAYLEPYSEGNELQVPIKRPELVPVDPSMVDPRIMRLRVEREIAIERVDTDSVILISRHAGLIEDTRLPGPRPGDSSVTIPRRAGESATFDGVVATLVEIDGAWRVKTTGQFTAWFILNERRTGFDLNRSTAR